MWFHQPHMHTHAPTRAYPPPPHKHTHIHANTHTPAMTHPPVGTNNTQHPRTFQTRKSHVLSNFLALTPTGLERNFHTGRVCSTPSVCQLIIFDHWGENPPFSTFELFLRKVFWNISVKTSPQVANIWTRYRDHWQFSTKHFRFISDRVNIRLESTSCDQLLQKGYKVAGKSCDNWTGENIT